ncbi:MAG TPA: ion channel [Flavisolibacter sp.]|jgi:inward rectifier potassium channel|nr:ion channel [Flavisolibacter sp.]
MTPQKKNLRTELTTGFGERGTLSGGRYYRKDGKPNVIRKGINFFDELSWYHTMLALPRWKFWLWLIIPYIIVNAFFAFIYYSIGVEHLEGMKQGSPWHNYIEAFFFSFQTFTTVGYGHVSPEGTLTSSVAAFESFLGVLTLALAAGLFYGRFSRPRSFLRFSDIALIAPYKDGRSLMFRTAPYKNNLLIDAEVKLTLGMRVFRNGEEKNEFYTLNVEIGKINALLLNWTIVHPINEDSPIYGMSLEELKEARAEVIVFLKAFDEGFANTVVARTSFTANEIIEGAKFKPMYERSPDGDATLLHIDKLNDYDIVKLPEIKLVES